MSSGEPSTSIHAGGSSPNEGTVEEHSHHIDNGQSTSNNNEERKANNSSSNNNCIIRKERPSRACTARAQARLQAAAAAEAATAAAERKKRAAKKERLRERVRDQSPSPPPPQTPQCKIITPLVREPPPSQQPRWDLRKMWELASILNFMNVFRPLLNIKAEFSAEELETALITPNNTLADIHIPLMKAIPPVTRMALGRNTWVTVLCRKLRDWWQWVAEGDVPIVASHGAETEAYKTLDPCTRVVILKALCDIRVEQEDIRNYIDDATKNGAQLSLFRKERVGGDSYGISYWYEDDPIIGHRLYREIRKVEVQKGKGKNAPPIDNSCFQWETVATNLDEFQEVSDKLFESKNRTEGSLGKKLKIDMLPEIEKVHKRKEKQLKKQHRQALLLDNVMNLDGITAGRSLRDRKPVTYTFDAYDRSINEAIKITKRKQSSPEPTGRQEHVLKHDVSANGKWNGPVQPPQLDSFEMPSPMSPDYDEVDEDHATDMADRSNRNRRRPQRYSAKDYVEAISENEEPDFDSDDDIVGEAVYDEEYLRQRNKQKRKMSSSSEGEEWEEEENMDEEEEEEDEDNSLSMSEDSDEPRRNKKKLPGRTRRETKLRSVVDLQAGLRRSRRATRNRIDYKQYELSDSEAESMKPRKSKDGSDEEFSEDEKEMETKEVDDEPLLLQQQETGTEAAEEGQKPLEKSSSVSHEDERDGTKRRFLDLNELAPGFGFDDGPSSTKDEDHSTDNP